MNIQHLNETKTDLIGFDNSRDKILPKPKESAQRLAIRPSGAGQRRLRIETRASSDMILAQVAQNDVLKSEEQELAEILIKYAPKDPHNKTIYNAARAGDERAVRLLIKYNADQDAYKSNTLNLAIISKSLPVVKYLVEEAKYVSGNELINSVRTDFFEGFDYFLNKGYPLPSDIVVNSMLILGDKKNNMERINFLLSRGADLACIEKSPQSLNSAMCADDMELFKFLLQHNAFRKVNECPWDDSIMLPGGMLGMHPLNFAFSYTSLEFNRRIEYVRLLVDSGMKIDPAFSKQIWIGYLKLTFRKKDDKTELLKSLIRNGLSVNDFSSGYNGYTNVLQYVIEELKDCDLFEMLLKNGADPNSKGYVKGPIETPLQTAVRNGDNRIIVLLIKYGAKL